MAHPVRGFLSRLSDFARWLLFEPRAVWPVPVVPLAAPAVASAAPGAGELRVRAWRSR